MFHPRLLTPAGRPLLAVLLTLGLGMVAHAQDLYVGSNTPNNTTNFFLGTNSYENTYVGNDDGSTNNLLTIGNTGTLLTNLGELYVGKYGSSNSMVISSGASVVNSDGYIGANSSNNSVLVTGTGSAWTNSYDLYIHASGNSLVISSGASVVNQYGYIGVSSSNNSVLVTGTNSTWTNSGDLLLVLNGSSNSLDSVVTR